MYLVVKSSRYDHVTPVLYSLQWLPVQYRICFKIFILTFKAIHGLVPEYISDLISVKDISTTVLDPTVACCSINLERH